MPLPPEIQRLIDSGMLGGVDLSPMDTGARLPQAYQKPQDQTLYQLLPLLLGGGLAGAFGGKMGLGSMLQSYGQQQNLQKQMQMQQEALAQRNKEARWGQAMDVANLQRQREAQEDVRKREKRAVRQGEAATMKGIIDEAFQSGVDPAAIAPNYGITDPEALGRLQAMYDLHARSIEESKYQIWQEAGNVHMMTKAELAGVSPDDPDIYVGYRKGPNAEKPSEVIQRLRSGYKEPKEPGMSRAELIQRAQGGDAEARRILKEMEETDVRVATGKAAGYPGQWQPLNDAAGHYMGRENKLTGEFVPASEDAQRLYTGAAPNIPQTTSEQMSGLKTAIDQLGDVESQIKGVLGPVAGRVKLMEINKLGGLGANKDEIRLVTKLYNLVTSQAFANGGKQLTITELERFKRMIPSIDDTVEQAQVKLEEATQFLRTVLANRILGLSPRVQELIDPEIVKVAAPLKRSAPSAPGSAIEWERDAKGDPIPKAKKP